MPSRRELIQMSEEEQRAFLAEQKTMTIVSNKSDGYPHPMPMWFTVDPDGTSQLVPVTVGRISGTTVEIIGDVAEGQEVVDP